MFKKRGKSFVVLLILSATAAFPYLTENLMPSPISAQETVQLPKRVNVLLNGQPIPGLKEIVFKVYKGPQELWEGRLHPTTSKAFALKVFKRGRQVQGIRPLTEGVYVKGRIIIRSDSSHLKRFHQNNKSFEIILSIMQDSYPESLGLKQFTFNRCHVDDREFKLDSHGYALTTYTFTADRIREE